MSYTVKTTRAGSWLLSEYRCPDHGIFEATVQRDANGDAPDEQPCQDCGEPSPWTISAPHPKVLSVPCSAVSRGGDMSERHPGMLDTRPLAEGMPMKEWRGVQDKHRQERRHKLLIDKGLKQKKIQV